MRFKPQVLIVLLVAALWAAAASTQLLLRPLRSGITDDGQVVEYTAWNNYVIFARSFDHLAAGTDLYAPYAQEYYDLYKYSPAFALLMAPLGLLPDAAGLVLWNALNAVLLVWGLWRLRWFSARYRLWALGFVLVELTTALQNCQSNALLAGLLLLSVSHVVEGRYRLGSVLFALAVCIKPNALALAPFFLQFDLRWRIVCWSLGAGIILFLSPWPFIGFSGLLHHYASWWQALQADAAGHWSLSVHGVLYRLAGIRQSETITLAAGILMALVPLIRFRLWPTRTFRVLYGSLLLIWMVLFSHKAESPTYIIAVCGVAWALLGHKLNRLNAALLALVFVFTQLVVTDLFPSNLRLLLIDQLAVKAWPCIAVFAVIWYRLSFKPEGWFADKGYAISANSSG